MKAVIDNTTHRNMTKTLRKYKNLNEQLVNLGYEQSTTEVMWNDCILEEIDNLLEDVNDEIETLIRLNLI